MVASCYHRKSILLTAVTVSRYLINKFCFLNNSVISLFPKFFHLTSTTTTTTNSPTTTTTTFLLFSFRHYHYQHPRPPPHLYCLLATTTATPPPPPHFYCFHVFISLLTDLLTTTKVFYFPSTTTTTTTTFLLFFPPEPLLHFYCFSFVFLDRFKVHVNECDNFFKAVFNFTNVINNRVRNVGLLSKSICKSIINFFFMKL